MNHLPSPLLLLTLTLASSVIAVHSSSASSTTATIQKYLRRTQNIPETFQSASSCPRKADDPRTECLIKEEVQPSGITVHCCSGTLGSNLRCERPNCRYVDSYADAEAFCVSKGSRLCTVPELNSNACCDKGCGFNNKLTWTSSVCSVGEIASIAKETTSPTSNPTSSPTRKPSVSPTSSPTTKPSKPPTTSPTTKPSASPTFSPTAKPSVSPTSSQTSKPSVSPTSPLTRKPSTSPSNSPVTIAAGSVSATSSPSNAPVATAMAMTLATTTSPTAAETTSISPSASAASEQDTNDVSVANDAVEVSEEALTTEANAVPPAAVPEVNATATTDTSNVTEENVDPTLLIPSAAEVVAESTAADESAGNINGGVLGIFFVVVASCLAAFLFVAFVQGRKTRKSGASETASSIEPISQS